MRRVRDRSTCVVFLLSIGLCLSGAAFASIDQQRSAVAAGSEPIEMFFSPTVPGAEETLFLDTRAPSNDAQVVTTMMTLSEGQTYRVTVQGTFSIWHPWAWTSYPTCDSDFPPDPGAMYPTPGVDGPVGIDPEFFYSSLIINGVCGGGFPLPSYYPYNFQVCLDGSCEYSSPSWHNPGLGLGSYSDYHPDHEYVYWVVGAGYPLSARRPDNPTSDNYGQMKIVVQQLSPDVEVYEITDAIGEMPDGAFPANGLRNALTNQYNKLFARIDAGQYCQAIAIIEEQIVRRINGIGPPLDAADWIYDPWREELLDQTMALKAGLLQLAGGICP